jgi:hypothetical protein
MNSNDDDISRITRWEKRRGKASLIKHLKGKQLTRQEAIEARCYECNGGWPDGVIDCRNLICALRPFFPYSEGALKSDSSVSVVPVQTTTGYSARVA